MHLNFVVGTGRDTLKKLCLVKYGVDFDNRNH